MVYGMATGNYPSHRLMVVEIRGFWYRALIKHFMAYSIKIQLIITILSR